jgi:hypothetical protein
LMEGEPVCFGRVPEDTVNVANRVKEGEPS